MSGSNARMLAVSKIIAIVIVMSAGLGALLGLFGTKLGLTAPMRVLVMFAWVTIVTRIVVRRYMAELTQKRKQ